jgi:Chromatin associated protein KTI12
MNSETILIVDAPNYIKGFRYQLYCAARELKLRVCTVRPSYNIAALSHHKYGRSTSSPPPSYAGNGTALARMAQHTPQKRPYLRTLEPMNRIDSVRVIASTTSS